MGFHQHPPLGTDTQTHVRLAVIWAPALFQKLLLYSSIDKKREGFNGVREKVVQTRSLDKDNAMRQTHVETLAQFNIFEQRVHIKVVNFSGNVASTFIESGWF